MSGSEPIEIHEYDARWPARFEAERVRLERVFAPGRVRVEHVGSTAVPGLAAKPIVDLMLGVERLEEVEARVAELESLGYRYHPEHERAIPERRFFGWPAVEPRQLHVHAVAVGGEFWDRHLLFRDWLREHASVAEEYAALKRDLAERFGSDRDGYTEAKSEFIASQVAEAARARDRGPT